MSEPLGDAGATIGKGSSTSLERTSGSDRSEKTGNESSTGDTLPAVTGRPNAYPQHFRKNHINLLKQKDIQPID